MKKFFLLLCLYAGTASAQPANDDCSNAIALPSPSSTCVSTVGTTVGVVTTDYDGCAEFEKRNVWYKFIATSSTHVVELTFGTMVNGIVDVYGGSCASLTSIGASCGSGQTGPVVSRTLTGLTTGTEYLISVSTREQSDEGSFSICVYTPPAPANDDCINAVSLPVSPSNVPVNRISATTGFATQSLPGCSGTADDDVWYSFTATQTSHRIFLQSANQPGSLANPVAEVFNGSCASLTLVQCISNFNATTHRSQLAVGLTPGQTYFLRVYSSNAGASGAGTFSIAITSLPQNDNCSSAVLATPAPTGSDACVSSLAGGTFDATQSSADCFGGSSTSNDTWYSFTATQEVHTVKVFGFDNNGIRFEVFQGTCAGLVSLGCGLPTFSGDTASRRIGNLTPGQTYFVRVYSGNSGGIEGLFNFCVTSPSFPANDACGNAITLTASSDSTVALVDGTTKAATNVSLPVSCNSVGLDVWYKFTAVSSQHVVKAVNQTNNSSLTIELYSGNCTALVHQRCSNGSDSLFGLGNLTIGQTYFVRIYNGSLNFGDDFRIGVFTPEPPSNDECTNAINIVPSTDASCIEVAGTNLGATQSINDNCTGNAFIGNIRDVWFRFTASASSHRIRLIRGAGEFLRFQLYSGDCNTLTSINCSVQNTSFLVGGGIEQRFDGLTIGTEYYIRVFNIGMEVPGTFDLCVKTVVAPANNECSSPITLTPQSSFTFGNFSAGSTTDASQSSQATQCSTGQDDDVWFQFTATQSLMKIFLQNGGIGPTRIAVYSGNCGALVLVKCQTGNDRDNAVVLPNLVAGTNYLVRIYSTASGSGQGSFSIIATTDVASQANDDCINAVTLVPSANNACTETKGSTADAFGSGNTTCINGNEVWYKFVATASSHRVNVQGLINTPVIHVFSGSCAGLASIPSSCSIGSSQVSATVNGLTIGNAYFVKVLSNSTAGFAQSIFTICVTTPQAPVNDLCSGAIVLPVASNAVDEVLPLYTTNLATFSGNANCPNTGNDVWFSFTAPTEPVIIEVNALTANAGIELLSGDCASLTSLLCNGTETGVNARLVNVLNPVGLTPGHTYFIRVSPASFAAIPIQFTIKVYKAASLKANGSIDTTCVGTNLVVNPGIETDFSFPDSFVPWANPGTEVITGWRLPTRGTADFFNAYNHTGSAVEVPFNICLGNQSPRNGYGYGGFFAYVSGGSGSREYLEGQLTSAMVPGQRYLVSMYVSLSDYSTIAVDNIGIALRTSATRELIFSNLNFTPQVVSPENVFLNDKKGWVNVSAVITADQPYTHFVIGNFKNNAATDTVRVADTSALLSGGTFAGCNIDRHIAYYFVDDVMVSQIGAGAGCGVLPLQLLEFTGRKRNATVELNWRTENEQNTSHFEVERSRNGIGFTSVGKKQAANSSGEHRYELTDVQPLDGINYYRLKQVDRDGRFVYSPIVRVKFEREREKLKIYPQPAQSTINVVFSGSSQLMVQVYDANGRNVMTEHKQNRGVLTLNVASLAKGAYWIVVTDGTLQQRGQFIKQ